MITYESDPTQLTNVHDPELFRNYGHQLIDLLANHIERVHQQDDIPVLRYTEPNEELNFWKNELQKQDPIMDTFTTILDHSINVHHPKYMGHQVAVPAMISSLAGLISDFMSNGTGVYEMGTSSNAIEKVVTDMVAKAIGFDHRASGILTSGGSLANLTALLAARQAKAPSNVWQNGHQEKLAIMVSEENHFCIDRAARILGLGDDGLIKIPVDDQYKIQTDRLESLYQEATNKGYFVIAAVGCACSTSTGSYDDLNALANFCEQHDLWFHVDGAHGAAVIFSDKYKHLAQGIERADSVVLDFHKMLMTPALNTALIFKKGSDAYHTFEHKAQYLWDAVDSEEWYNTAKRTFECTKYMMSIKVYAIIKMHGIDVFGQNVDLLYDNAKTFSKLIENRENFELAVCPQANIINFRYLNNVGSDINELNSGIREKILEEGHFYIVQTMLGGNRYLRVSLMNPLTTLSDFTELLDHIEEIALKLSDC